MTGGSAETDWKMKARARRQVKERPFHLGGVGLADDEGDECKPGDKRISSARKVSSRVPLVVV